MQRVAFSGARKVSEPLPQDAEVPVVGDAKAPWILKELSPVHKQVIALLVQGVDRSTIAEVCGIVPEYVTMLAKQPLCQEYFKELEAFADLRLVALAEKRSDVIHDILVHGKDQDRLSAAKLQMEATGKIGGKSTITINQITLDSALGSAASALLDKLRVVHQPVTIDQT